MSASSSSTAASLSAVLKQNEIDASSLKILHESDNLSLALHTTKKIAIIFFHYANKSVNVLNNNILGDLRKFTEEIETNHEIKAVVLFSLKNNSFIAGADVNMLQSLQTVQAFKSLAIDGHKEIFRIERMHIPVIAAVHGSCLGGGLEVAMGCSHRFASEHESTQFGLPEVKLGLIPGLGGTVRLPRIIGLSKAVPMILAGTMLNTQQARRTGLVDSSVAFQSTNQFFGAALEYSEGLSRNTSFNPLAKFKRASKGIKELLLDETPLGRAVLEFMSRSMIQENTGKLYPAPFLALESMLRSYTVSIEDAALIETKNFSIAASTLEGKNLVKLFIYGDESKKIGEQSGAKDQQSYTVGILSASPLAAEMAQAAVMKNLTVKIYDESAEKRMACTKQVDMILNTLIQRRRITPEKKGEIMKNISFPESIEDTVANCALIVELGEASEQKKQNLISLDAALKQSKERLNIPIIVNASQEGISLSSDIIPSNFSLTSCLVGAQVESPFFKNLVAEVIKTNDTNNDLYNKACRFFVKLGRMIAPNNSSSQTFFVGSRLLSVYCLEAIQQLIDASKSSTPAKAFNSIQSISIRFGMIQTPFTLFSEYGAERLYSIVSNYIEKVDKEGVLQQDYKLALESLQTMAETKAKFQNKAKNITPEFEYVIQKAVSKSTLTLAPESKALFYPDRMFYSLLRESVECIEQKLCTEQTIELIALLKLGFAPPKGGILTYSDTLGAEVISTMETMQTELKCKRFTPPALLSSMKKQNATFFKPNGELVEYKITGPIYQAYLWIIVILALVLFLLSGYSIFLVNRFLSRAIF